MTSVLAAPSVDLVAGFQDSGSENAGQAMDWRKREVIVNLNQQALDLLASGSPVSSLHVALFPDVELVLQGVSSSLQLDGTAVNEFSISGDGNGSAVLAVTNGVLFGTVTTGANDAYRIRREATGAYLVEELDPSRFPECATPSAPLDTTSPDRPSGPSAHEPSTGAVINADDGTLIKVLVAYTQAAETAVGGANSMASLIATAESETNAGYVTSGINFLIDVVNTAKVTYDESTGYSQALDALTNNGDGLMDSVHALRDSYAADLVVLIIDNGNSCGIAWKPSTVSSSNANYGFSVVGWNCATGYYSFAHEMGHNMGAGHDTYVDPSTSPYAYGHGYVNTAAQLRSIMAYNNACADAGFYCPRVNHWSATDRLYNGSTTIGDASATNNVALNNSALAIANYRSVPTGGQADLAITILEAPEGIYAAGGAMDVIARIENIGSVTSNPYNITFYASSDTNITTEDYGDWYWPMDALGAGANHHFIFPWNLSDPLPNGQYYIGAIVTVSGDGNTANNTRYDPMPITVASVPAAPTLSSVAPGDGEVALNFTSNGNGGSVITGYTASCGAFDQAGASSPITVGGLTNGIQYACSVIATNVIGDSPASNVVLATPAPAANYGIGGFVSGLAGSGLVLQNNGGDDLAIVGNGNFTFNTMLENGTGYAVTVGSQPLGPDQFCVVSNGSGLVSGGDVTDIGVTCTLLTSCNVKAVSGITEQFDTTHEACEILVIGPDYVAANGANVTVNSGVEINFLPGFTVEQGATLDAFVCGQSLCATNPSPMPYGCHSCVNQICDIDPDCCDLSFDQACLDMVDSVCGLTCE